MNEELARFLVLFDRMVHYTDSWLDRMDPDKYDWAPIENSSTRFGSRVARITVKSLVEHTVLAERNWIRKIQSCKSGDTVPLPNDPDAAGRFGKGDFRSVALELHQENMALASTYGPAELEKKLEFVGRHWTGMGLLWGMYAHRAFHVGNIDIYLRQSDVTGPEFFEFSPVFMA